MISAYLSRRLKQINKALTGYNDQDVTDFNEDVTAELIGPLKRALNTHNRILTDFSGSDQTVTSVTQNRVIVATAFANVRKGDVVRFITGNNAGIEYELIHVDSGNNIGVLAYDPYTTINPGDTFRVFRYVTPTGDSTGASSASLSNPKAPIAKAILDFSLSNVTDSAYTQLISDIGGTSGKQVQIFMSSGVELYLAFGGAGSEVDKIIVLPGGRDVFLCDIPANTRLSVKSAQTGVTVSEGKLMINIFG